MTAIEKLRPMSAELARVETVQECATLAEKAKAVQTWAKHIGLSLEEQNRVARFRVDCMRKAGGMLIESVRRGGRGGSKAQLAPLGVERVDSQRWQRLARLDESLVEQFAAECNENTAEFTHAGLLRFVASIEKAAKREAATANDDAPDVVDQSLDSFVAAASADPTKRFGCVYADPPWRYGNQGTRAATGNHYGTMTVDEICALPVREIVAENAHLHLWTTNAFLFEAKRVMEAWGFEYKSCFVWVKPQMGIGNYWRVSHEFMLLGIRGDAPFLAKNEMSWAELPRGRHSAKPDDIRKRIEKVSPGPRIELFARDAFEGWSAWGNQTKHSLFTTTPKGGGIAK